jgi:hypothetical protein
MATAATDTTTEMRVASPYEAQPCLGPRIVAGTFLLSMISPDRHKNYDKTYSESWTVLMMVVCNVSAVFTAQLRKHLRREVGGRWY